MKTMNNIKRVGSKVVAFTGFMTIGCLAEVCVAKNISNDKLALGASIGCAIAVCPTLWKTLDKIDEYFEKKENEERIIKNAKALIAIGM